MSALPLLECTRELSRDNRRARHSCSASAIGFKKSSRGRTRQTRGTRAASGAWPMKSARSSARLRPPSAERAHARARGLPRCSTKPSTACSLPPIWRRATHLLQQFPADPSPDLRWEDSLRQPPSRGNKRTRDREVLDALLEVTRVRVHAAEHDLIAEHETLVDQIDGFFVHRVAARHR